MRAGGVGATEDEMVGWYHPLNGHKFEQPPGDSEGQRSLAHYSPWVWKELDTIELNNSDNSSCWASFHVFFWQICLNLSPIFLIGLFVLLILSCMSCLYVLEINPLWVTSLQIFFPTLWVVFHLLYGFLCFVKAFKLIRSHLLIFVFIFIILGGGSKISFCDLCQRVFCLCFQLDSLKVI